MRYLVRKHTRDGGLYFEGEILDPQSISDWTDDVVTREQAMNDPQLKAALEAWDKRDDSLAAINEAQYALEEGGKELSEALDYFTQAMPFVRSAIDAGGDDVWCRALAELFPLVEQAFKIGEELPKLPPLYRGEQAAVDDAVAADVVKAIVALENAS